MNTIILNGAQRTFETPLSIQKLIEALDLDSTRVAVEVNRVVVPRARHREFQLLGGESVEVVTLVGGG